MGFINSVEVGDMMYTYNNIMSPIGTYFLPNNNKLLFDNLWLEGKSIYFIIINDRIDFGQSYIA